MRPVSLHTRISIAVRGIMLMLAMLFTTLLYAQDFSESEPNNSCLTAQSFGDLSLPTTVVGSLDSTPEFPDVDFFKFESISGQTIVVDLEGSTTGAGTLGDPFLGLFDSECNLLAINDDSNGLNSRLIFTIPEDGLFVLGATNCCDSSFIGGGIGSYLLAINQLIAINAIEGRLINATNTDPLTGSDPTYANATLLGCDADGCFDFKANQPADSEGRFSFQVDQFGNPLQAGDYQIQAFALGFDTFTLEPFTVGVSETLNLGDIGLLPLQYVASIRGRVVDALSGSPLAGNALPYPFVYLDRCDDQGCNTVAASSPDDLGDFLFDGISYNLNPGSYRLVGLAQDYQQYMSSEFSAMAFEQVDFGDLPLTPLPIQFGEALPCTIPSGGGLCEYSVEVSYRGSASRYRGEIWSIVEFYSPPEYRVTRFQVGKRGIKNTNPQRLNLRQGENETVSFQLNVPQTVPDGSTICGYINVGQEPEAQFNNQGEQFIFCSYKEANALIPMSEKEARKQVNKLKSMDKSLLKVQCISSKLSPLNQFSCDAR
jgi:hypothetical protein